jgi:hypothetical protein
MPQPTAYQYVKLGSNLEYLRGIATVSIMLTTSLAACPKLLANLPMTRYSVMQVAGVIRTLLAQLEEMGLAESLREAEPLCPMLKELEDYLSRQAKPELARLKDEFAERLIVLAITIGFAVRTELGSLVPAPAAYR